MSSLGDARNDLQAAQAFFLQAVAHGEAGDLTAAMAAYEHAISLDPCHFGAFHRRGNIARRMGQLDLAAASYERATHLKPDFINAWINNGVVLRQLGRTQAAISCFDAAIALQPDNPWSHFNRGNALFDLKRHEDAVASYDHAIAIDPHHPPALFNRGNALLALAEYEKALASYDACLAEEPGHARAHAHRALALAETGCFAEALESCDQAIALSPNLAFAHMNRSIFLLSQGDLKEGFKAHEWRSEKDHWPEKRWRGDAGLAGQSILIHCEDGLGDTIQFCRYLAPLAKAGARVYFAPQRSLRALMARMIPEVEIVRADFRAETIPYDLHSPLLSLPFALGTTIDTIPAPRQYLFVDDRTAQWRERLGADGFKIAICWQGSTNAYDAGRSFAVAEFERLSKLPGIRLISVHKGAGADQLQALPEGMSVESLEGLDAGPHAFLDTAAVMKSCELVITSDTSVAHLAGALGLEVWVVLKHNPAWRWLRERGDSPWYPSMRLFRQPSPGDWRTPFAEMEAALHARLG